MSIRERIMAIRPIFADDAPEFHYGCFYRGCELSADIAEARERELQNELDDVLSDFADLRKDFAELSESEQRLLAQRDELLAALKYSVNQVPELGTVPGVAAAIAKAEGGGA